MASPHVLMVPWPVQGHVIPLMELAQCIVQHGVKVTFVNTEIIHERLLSSLAAADHKDVLDVRVHLVAIPDGLESDEERRIPGKLSEAIYRFLPGKLEELIQGMNASSVEEDRVTCLIADQGLGWAQEVARKLGIRRVAFLPAAAATLAVGFNIPRFIQDGIIDKDGTPIKKQIVQLAPSMPLVNSEEFVWARLGNSAMQKAIFQGMLQNNLFVKMADWVICNSTYDLEPGAFSLALEIVPVGPLLASNRLGNSAGQFLRNDSTCLNWLDKQPHRSVIYVAFGSTCAHSKPQVEEFAAGLELTHRPFLWVVPPDVRNTGHLEGVIHRVSTQGQVVSWAPQQKVLSHPAIACFLSHCGWNSIVESVSNGVPMLCWPYFADQFLNQSYVCDIWKVGLGLRGDEERGMVTSEEIKKKMDEVVGSISYKERALNMQEIVMKNAREGGSSHKNFTKFIAWLKE